MDDLEQLLRDYGRDADDAVRPVSMDDLGSRPVSSTVGRPARFTRVWRGHQLISVAACVVLAVGLGFVLGRMSAPVVDELPPAESTVIDPFVTLPEPAPTVPPDPIDELMETSIGSISWTRVEGDPESMPRRVVAREGDTLIGGDTDPTIRWTSVDGGATWDRSVIDGVRREAGDHEWVWRPSDDGHGLARVTSDGDIPVDLGPAISVSADWTPWIHVALDGLPVELDGTAFVLSSSGVSLDLSDVADALDATSIEVVDGESSTTRLFGDQRSWSSSNTPSLRLVVSAHDDSSYVDLIDEAGEVIVTVDTRIEGLPDRDTIDMVTGASSSQWSAFDGERFVPIDVPWPPSNSVNAARVDDAVLVITDPGGRRGGSALWRTTDGRNWENIAIPIGDASSDDVVMNLFETGDGAIAEVLSNELRRYSTEDGQTFEELSRVPNTANRQRTEIGWFALDYSSSPTLWVSDDGDEWERVTITGLYDNRTTSSGPPSGELYVDGSTIYIATSTGRDYGDRTLLIGDVTPPSPGNP